MSIDNFTNRTEISPARGSFSITPNDSTELTVVPKAVYVGTGGNIVARLVGDSTDVTFNNVADGTILPFQFKLIKSTSTTASNLVGLV